jgi:hypothetical protein
MGSTSRERNQLAHHLAGAAGQHHRQVHDQRGQPHGAAGIAGHLLKDHVAQLREQHL